MRRRGGIGNQFFSLVGALIMLGIFLAAVQLFGGDVVGMMMWILGKMADFVLRVKDAFLGMPVFRGLFN